MTCNTPPPSFCASSTTLRSYTAAGTCTNGACGYATTDSTCSFGCTNGRCNPDPCAGVSCTTAPAADCANSTTRRTYTAPGSCSGGRTGGGACPLNTCSGGRECIDGFCLCPGEPLPIAPQGEESVEGSDLICPL